LGWFLRLVAENAGSHDRSGSNPEPKCKFNSSPQSRSYVQVVALRRRGNLPRLTVTLAYHLQRDDPISSAAGVQF
jgi:hypothetical protein